MKKSILLIIAAFAISMAVLNAQTATLVKDINTKGDAFSATDKTQPFLQNGKYVFFESNNGTDGRELFRTDGTDAGTIMLKNINPTGNANPIGLKLFKNEVYFSAFNGTSDAFYKTDGTVVGTVLVKDIEMIGGFIKLPEMIEYKDELFFGDVNGNLWKTDGTTAGTKIVSTIYTGSFDPKYIRDFTIFNNKLYFSARTGSSEISFMESDGTTAGTKIVKNLYPNDDDNVAGVTASNGKIFYSGRYLSQGNNELFVSDGTAVGTKFLKDLNNKTGISDGTSPLFFTPINGTTIFLAGNSIWKSDGTAAGTVAITTFSAGLIQNDPSPFLTAGNIIYSSGGDSFGNQQLWVINGTTAGTQALTSTFLSLAPKSLTMLGNKCYFSAQDPDKGRELWVSDGTKIGTKLALDLIVGATGSQIANIVNLNGTLFFIATKGDAAGYELYKYSPIVGTNDLTILKDEIAVSPNPAHESIKIQIKNSNIAANIRLFDIKGKLVKQQNIQHESELIFDTNNLSKGMYFIEYSTERGIQTEKIIVE